MATRSAWCAASTTRFRRHRTTQVGGMVTMDKIAIAWISIVVLDGGVAIILVAALRGISIKAVLREKDPKSQPSPTQAAAVAGGAAADDPALANTSYSRLSGFIGSTVLA